MTAVNLYATILRSIDAYHDRHKWDTLCANCMRKDFSWETSAKAYRAVYMKVLGR